jgi:hypothetical protein
MRFSDVGNVALSEPYRDGLSKKPHDVKLPTLEFDALSESCNAPA